jgi:predicted metal-dependent hydrolase
VKKLPTSSVEHITIEVAGKEIPAKIYRERRRNVRFSIAKKGAILRMPLLLLPEEQNRHRANFRRWVAFQFSQKESLKDHFFGKQYRAGDTLTVGRRAYFLDIAFTESKTHTARLHGQIIQLRLTAQDTEVNLQKAVKHLLSRIVAQDFFSEITQRVITLNDRHFKKPVRSVNLKYNLSNWGSCSSRGNINLSTRLLFAPDDVVDYVVIHELAHLVEMNHSDRFWSLVEKAMPDYKEKILWLKNNWRDCDF